MKIFVQMSGFKVRISQNIGSFARNSPKQALKYTIFFNIQKGQKKAKSFYFWQTVSRKGKWQPWYEIDGVLWAFFIKILVVRGN